MPLRRVAKIWFLGSLVVIVGLVALDFFVGGGGGWVAYWLIKLPKTRDKRLVGTWVSITPGPFSGEELTRITVFGSNGRGSWSDDNRFRLTFEWGTEDGVLFTRRMATDDWSARQYPYQYDSKTDVITFGGQIRHEPVSAHMQKR